MSDTGNTDAQQIMGSDAGQALRRIVQDDTFRQHVATDPVETLKQYELDGEVRDALAADAKLLGDEEVSGFAAGKAPTGLRTPATIGVELTSKPGICYNTNVEDRALCWHTGGGSK